MLTYFHVKMSPRMERLWSYIRDVEKISLHTMSTDRCVENSLPELRQAMKKLVDRLAVEEDPVRRTSLEMLRADLHCIMRRRPANRADKRSKK